MASGMFLIQDSGGLVEMTERAYDSEAFLQDLLARYPNLLAGDQMDSVAPRRWLLVTREMALPSEEEGPGRWAVDHLFLDQDAIPTLVEVKRSSDTRMRREVIGQMLEYAANAVVYWPLETIRAQFEAGCTAGNLDVEQVLAEFLGADADVEGFWQRVKTNLQAGRVRVVFVADVIPAELRRVVEFLSAQMDPAEVLAVEIRQFVGQGLKTLVPRAFGQTAEAERPAPRESRQWDEESFFQNLEARRSAEEIAVARRVLEWLKARDLKIRWGKGKTWGSFYPLIEHKSTVHWTFSVWEWGIEIEFQYMRTRPPFDDEEKRLELLRRLNEVPGISLPADAITRRPSIPLGKLSDEDALSQFLAVFDWYVEEVVSASSQ